VRLFIFFVMLGLSGLANADWRSEANWQLVNETSGGETSLFYDPSTVKTIGSNIELWTLLSSHTSEYIGGKGFKSRGMKILLDCKKSSYKRLSMLLYEGFNGDGKIIQTMDAEGMGIAQWESAVPGSLFATLFYLCK